MRREMIAQCLRDLEREGWLRRKKRFGNSTLYTLILPSPLKDRAGEPEQF